MSLIIDETMYKGFLDEGVNDDTARAFGHFFAYAQGKCNLENYLREKFEKIGLLDPYGETIHMEDIESSLEWLLLVQCFEGKIERIWSEKEQVFKYRNTKLGEAEAIQTLRRLTNSTGGKPKG